MNREIKFRLWYSPMGRSEQGQMIYSNESSHTFFIGFNGKLYENYGSLNNPKKELWESVFDSDWELMQFTGLKDKNGKEIYEGDIILIPSFKTFEYSDSKKTSGYERKIDVKFLIEWRNLGWELKMLNPPKWETEYGHSHSVILNSNGNYGHLDYWKIVFIVGNIYENPELLNNGAK